MMFIFNLQKVLDFRKLKEDEAKMYLEQLQRKFSLHMHVLKQIEDSIVEEENKMYCVDGHNPNILWLKEQYIQSLKSDLSDAMQHKILLEESLKKQQEILLEHSKNSKIMSSLKEKNKEKFYKEMSSKSQNELDEMVSVRFQK
ncbi:MAG: flagellar export protein FliJ [Desulfovibrionaceae bacterium]